MHVQSKHVPAASQANSSRKGSTTSAMSSWQQKAVQLLLHVHLQLLSELLLVILETEWLSWLLLLA